MFYFYEYMGKDHQAEAIPEQPEIERRAVTAGVKLRTIDRNRPMWSSIYDHGSEEGVGVAESGAR